MSGLFRKRPGDPPAADPRGHLAPGEAVTSFEILGFNLRLLRFRSSQRLELGAWLEIPLDVPGLGPTRIPATLVARDPGPEATIYTAEVQASLPVRQHLFARFGSSDAEEDRELRHDGPERRSQPRFRTTCQARSRSLPGFQALTWDLTPRGTRLVAQAGLEPGTGLELTLDLDDALVEELALSARVVWSHPVPGAKGSYLGLQFTGGRGRALEGLELYVKRKVGR